MLQPGAVVPCKKRQFASASRCEPLNPLTHRNTGYQPLPKPLGLPPYQYDLSDHFKDVAGHITDSGKLVMDVMGDSGGIQDGQFQSDVAGAMVKALGRTRRTSATT